MVAYTDIFLFFSIFLVLLFRADVDSNQKTRCSDNKRETTADVHQKMITREKEVTTCSSGEDGVDESWIGREEKDDGRKGKRLTEMVLIERSRTMWWMLRRSKDKSLAAGTGVLKILAPPKKKPRYICYSMQKII